MKKLLATAATVLICFCFLAYVNRDDQRMMFCNETEDGRHSLSEFEFEGAELIKNWERDDPTCTEDCSFWRIWKLKPEDIICVEIEYTYGKKEI